MRIWPLQKTTCTTTYMKPTSDDLTCESRGRHFSVRVRRQYVALKVSYYLIVIIVLISNFIIPHFIKTCHKPNYHLQKFVLILAWRHRYSYQLFLYLYTIGIRISLLTRIFFPSNPATSPPIPLQTQPWLNWIYPKRWKSQRTMFWKSNTYEWLINSLVLYQFKVHNIHFTVLPYFLLEIIDRWGLTHL